MIGRVSLVLILISQSTWAWTDESFQLRDIVVAKRTLILRVDNRIVDKSGPGQVLKVQGLRGSKLWVSRGRPGWINASDVIALNQAEAFFQKPFATGASARDCLARGTVRVALGKHAEAIADLQKAVNMAGDSGEYLEPLGYAQLSGLQQAAAIETFSKALQDDPKSAPALMGRGLAFYQVGDYRKSQADLTRAVELEPEHAFPRKYLGVVLHDLNDLRGAKEQLSIAVKVDAHDAFIRKSLGRLQYDLGDLDSALTEFGIAIGLDETDIEAIVGRGVVLHAIGKNLKGAEEDFSRAIGLSTETVDNAYLWSNLGQVQGEMGKSTEAMRNLNKAVELDPNFLEARSHRAYQRVAENTSKEEIEAAKADMRAVFASDDPRTFWDYRALAGVNAAIGDYSRAAYYQTQGEMRLRETGPRRFVKEAAELRVAYQSTQQNNGQEEGTHQGQR